MEFCLALSQTRSAFSRTLRTMSWSDCTANTSRPSRKRDKGMRWVQKYLLMKRVIMFKLSHDALQVRFQCAKYSSLISDSPSLITQFDHSNLIFSLHGNLITRINKHYKITHWPLSGLMARPLSPQPLRKILKLPRLTKSWSTNWSRGID